MFKKPKPGTVPLERALSKLGLASRTEARVLIRAGKVKVRGAVVSNPLAMVVPETARIEIEGISTAVARPITVMLHKPAGVVTTRSDEKGRKTVYSLLDGLEAHVIPVGRLDLASTGLLLFTNDTQFSAWVTDPKNNIPKVYLVSVRGEVTDEYAARLESGIRDEGELLKADRVVVRKRSKRESHLVVTLSEGKNREIRRMLSAAGHEVTRLKRVEFGGLSLGELKPGAWRELSSAELRSAFPGAPLKVV